MKNLLSHYVAVFDVSEHKTFKKDVIDLLGGDVARQGPLKLARTDWNNNSLQEPYQRLLNKYLLPYLEEYCIMIHNEHFKIDKQWFVEYPDGNAGTAWHSHACQFSSVYYLHMDYADDRTEFRDMEAPYAEEGNLIIFPSFLVHRSPKARGSKVVVSTNFNVDGAASSPIDL